MNYESYAFVHSFLKKMIIPYIVIIIIILIQIFLYVSTPVSKIPNHYEVFQMTAGIPLKHITDNIFLLLQGLVTILGCYFYFDYETENSPEFTKTRMKNEKIYIHKLFIITIFLLVIRSIYFYLLYNIFSPNVEITIFSYIASILPQLILTILYYLYKLISHKLSTM